MARLGLWPTPVANDDNKSPEAHMRMKANMPGGARATCTSLNVMVKGVEMGLWPTPTTRDWKDGTNVKNVPQNLLLGRTVEPSPEKGALHPNWVSLLMGYARDWTIVKEEFMPRKPTNVSPKSCATCGKQMLRKDFNGRPEDLGCFKRRKFCSLSCANTRQEIGYHGQQWRARHHLKTCCEVCGGKVKLSAHHLDEDRSNSSSENIQTLCMSCHIRWHHEARRRGVTPSGKAEFRESGEKSQDELIDSSVLETP
jgi:5-methylcytosine-specific restriction endonuclease McrA